jgi:FtsH-binding integral membrane protein
MENYDLRYGEDRYSVAASPASERVTFLKRTYGHLAGAVLALIAIEGVLFQSGLAEPLIRSLFSDRLGVLALMVLFIGGGYAAQYMARSATSDAVRYAGLALYVGIQAVILLPLLYIAERNFPGQHLPLQAGIITAAAFAGITFGVAVSGKDFSFLGPILWAASLVALGVVLCSFFFGGGGGLLGTVFSGAMVLLAAGYIVYDTSNVMHHYRSDQYVSAALELFASVALMFYYVLRLLMSLQSSRD